MKRRPSRSSRRCWTPARRSSPTIRKPCGSREAIFGASVELADKSYEALHGADALAIVTEWNEFREPDFTRIRKMMRTPVIFDGRNLYNPEQLRGGGFTYYSMGRP